MLKLMTLMIVMAAGFVATPNNASAQQRPAEAGTSSGYCPPGTCAIKGGAFARDVRTCSKANCVAGPTKGQQKK